MNNIQRLGIILSFVGMCFLGYAENNLAANNSEEEYMDPEVIVYVDTPEEYEKAVIEACEEAKEDFSNGKSRYIVCGLPTANTRRFAEYIQKEYGIEPEFKGCVVSHIDMGFASTYNEMTRLLFLTKKDISLGQIYYDILNREESADLNEFEDDIVERGN